MYLPLVRIYGFLYFSLHLLFLLFWFFEKREVRLFKEKTKNGTQKRSLDLRNFQNILFPLSHNILLFRLFYRDGTTCTEELYGIRSIIELQQSWGGIGTRDTREWKKESDSVDSSVTVID